MPAGGIAGGEGGNQQGGHAPDVHAKVPDKPVDADEKEANDQLNLAKKLIQEDDVYQNDNAIQARGILRNIVTKWPHTEAAAEAKGRLPAPKSAKQAKADEEYAAAQVKYAKKLIDEWDNPYGARERLLKVVNSYGETEAATEARKLLKKLVEGHF